MTEFEDIDSVIITKGEFIRAIDKVLEEIEPRPTDRFWKPVDSGVALTMLRDELKKTHHQVEK